ncbi:HK97 gp10 family phage protein [Lachnoclostridium sp. Marseille-P6806]|jgi:hypothetical protein|uniref:HK97 gp10 family phage protein n=1 Tax=Lachnoclostridium sp. Marseille-P6806 TaxID=2364793 RepID=UPI002060FA9F|nr:MAG TPA_asm: putative tail component [Caudoviricetes sp.]
MSSSNYRRNKAAIDQYHKELMAMLDDVREIDIKILNQAVNEGMRHAKDQSPVITGFFRKNWRSAPAVRTRDGGVSKNLVNSADYASYVNYGHRTVDSAGNTTGYVRSDEGDHLLEKTLNYVSKRLIELFQKEVEAVQHRHDK